MEIATLPIEFEIETAFGVLPPYHIEVPDVPLGLKDVVPFVQQVALDIVHQAAVAGERAGKRVQCAPGCSMCCFYPLPISAPEAIFSVEHLLRMPIGVRHAVLERFELNELQCEKNSLLEPLRKSQAGIDIRKTGEAYFNLHLPCPFLYENKCAIHPVRPITCREHNVVSPPELCRNPFEEKTEPLGLQRHLSERLQAAADRLCNVGRGNVALPLVFEWYEKNREIAKMRWRGPELFSLVIEMTAGDGVAA